MSNQNGREAEVTALVQRLGRLPDAPLAMPKQRLEPPGSPLAVLLARLVGRAPQAGDMRPTGR